MNKLLLIGMLLTSNYIFAQNEIDVADITLKVGGVSTEEKYFGFAEGDKIIFSMTEKNGKEIKDVNIIEYPNNTKFQDRSTSKIENKIFNVNKKTIYKFSFYNSNISGRVINIIIKRIPANENTKAFNTNIVFKNIIDTTYKAETKQVLISSDTSFVEVINTNALVHSGLNDDGPREILDFILPANTVKWAYRIGVGDESSQAYKEDQESVLNSGVQFISTFNPMAGLLLGAVSLTKSNTGENVEYSFIPDYENALNFKNGKSYMQYKSGNVITDDGIQSPRENKQFVGLYNDNTVQAISVNVIITALVVKNKYEMKVFKTPVITNIETPFNE